MPRPSQVGYVLMTTNTKTRIQFDNFDTLLSLKKKTALITGAADGIGAAIAERFAWAGADLILIDINESTLRERAQRLRKLYHVKVDTSFIDLANPEAIMEFWKHCKTVPDILVNNAGIYPPRDFTDSDKEFVDRTMQINLGAVMSMCREMIARRKKEGGVIINMGSIEAKTPFKEDLSIYSVSKAGVLALTRSLAREYASKGFKINALVPGGIVTEGTSEMARGAFLKFRFNLFRDAARFSQRLPVGRVGQPDDIARMALVMAAPISDYMSGAEITIDGGFLTA
jgi:3-oxoacyl-[acyl-carrier protein] reductase